MHHGSKVRAQPNKVVIHVSDDVFDAVNRYCSATGASRQYFGARAIEMAVDQIGNPDDPILLPRRETAKSA